MVGPGIIAGEREANVRIGALSSDYAKLCARIDVPYLEICHLLLASRIWIEEALAADGAHPNRGGYSVVAAAVSSWRAWRSWMER
jgi:acyl-CoA thioesterase I